jgi:putative membrane protein
MAWHALTRPAVSWLVHAAALWLWHVPALFDAALASDGVHALQHLSFLVSALLFWWAVLGHGWQRPNRAAAMIYLFTTMLHTGALGVLLTWSTVPWYASYADAGGAFGLSLLEDQQLGGLIMWIPGGLVYVLAGLFLGAQWLARVGSPVDWQVSEVERRLP